MTAEWHARALDTAVSAGAIAGQIAWEWQEQYVTGGRVTASGGLKSARRILVGLADGDPEILDGLPWLDLSGQWADGPSESSVLDDVEAAFPIYPNQRDYEAFRTERLWAREDPTSPRGKRAAETLRELVDAYEESFNAAVVESAERTCRELLASVTLP